jgi:xanthine dehydrogenase YagR molybdenum-binding subunit
MKFDHPAASNPIDQLKVVGRPVDRIDGPLKTTGRAPYAAERHDVVAGQAHGFIVGAAIATGRIVSIDLSEARRASGVIAIVTADNAGPLAKGDFIGVSPLAGPVVLHYHQAVAVVVAETFEQARAAASLVKVRTNGGPAPSTLKPVGRAPCARNRFPTATLATSIPLLRQRLSRSTPGTPPPTRATP